MKGAATSKKRGGLTGKLLLAATSCLVTLGLAELLLPALLDLEKVTLAYDPLLGFRGRARLTTVWRREMAGGQRIVRTNSEGFHDRQRQRERTPGSRRLVFLGDSFLEAYQVEIEENFSQLVAANLTRRHQRYSSGDLRMECLNQGVHGYGLGVHYLYVRERLMAFSRQRPARQLRPARIVCGSPIPHRSRGKPAVHPRTAVSAQNLAPGPCPGALYPHPSPVDEAD